MRQKRKRHSGNYVGNNITTTTATVIVNSTIATVGQNSFIYL